MDAQGAERYKVEREGGKPKCAYLRHGRSHPSFPVWHMIHPGFRLIASMLYYFSISILNAQGFLMPIISNRSRFYRRRSSGRRGCSPPRGSRPRGGMCGPSAGDGPASSYVAHSPRAILLVGTCRAKTSASEPTSRPFHPFKKSAGDDSPANMFFARSSCISRSSALVCP